MRPNCPICNTPGEGDWKLDFIVPDGWTLPTTNTVLYCPACGMIWYNNDRTQEDYDRYYAERYGFDGSLFTTDNRGRLDDLANLTMKHVTNKDALIVDFGGGDGYIEAQLKAAGYANARTVDVGDILPQGIDWLICAEVLEHIRDIGDMVERLCRHMTLAGKMLIELPDARRMPLVVDEKPLIDFQQKHVNHFNPENINALFARNGYYPEYSETCHVNGHVAFVYRVIYEPLKFSTYGESRHLVTRNIATMSAKLRKLGDQPVIVWGCGDIAMHLLTKVNLNVKHFVDLDPAFKDTTIHGRPVLDSPVGGYPIIVMAMGQRTAILKSIADAGYTNEVIEI